MSSGHERVVDIHCRTDAASGARSVGPVGPVDLDRLSRAVREMLEAIGEDPDREGLRETPARVARAYAETLAGLREDPADHLKRTVDVFARRPQLQERMTAQIADALVEHLDPLGVLVLVEGRHLCLSMRGPRSGSP